jgi:DNA-binding MarR family transcriptional regulator
LQDTTVASGSFPDDDLRHVVRRFVRLGGLLEPHDHDGLQASLSEVMALGELVEVEAMSQQELAALLGLEKSTVSRLAAGMEKRGWLARDRDPANRRYYRLRLTPDGRAAAVRVGEHLRSHHQRLLGGLTAAERDGLAIGLAGLARVMDAQHSGHEPG